MCLSPHEMSTQAIEEKIQQLHSMVGEARYSDVLKKIWLGRIEGFEGILKERAEQGVI